MKIFSAFKLNFSTLILKLRLPFDWKNPFGYLIAIASQTMMTAYGLTFLVSVGSFGIGSYSILKALTRDIIRLLLTIDESAESEKNHKCILKLLSELIQYHSDVKQL